MWQPGVGAGPHFLSWTGLTSWGIASCSSCWVRGHRLIFNSPGGWVGVINTFIHSGELRGGNPARHLRALKPEEASFIVKSACMYSELGAQHGQGTAKAA